MSANDGQPETAFDITAKECRATATYRDEGSDADVRFWVKGELVREFTYPAYRIWNIAAHFEHDIVPDLLAEAEAVISDADQPDRCVICGHPAVRPYACEDCREDLARVESDPDSLEWLGVSR